MRPRISIVCAAGVLLIAANAVAADIVVTERLQKEVSLALGGSLWLDNPYGSIEVIGIEGSSASMTVVKTTTGVDRAAVNEGREQIIIGVEGDPSVRLIRTIVPPMRSERWSSSVSYTLRVPRTVHVKVATKVADQIRISNIRGNVTVKAFAGTIVLDGVSGASIIDTTNGRVIYLYHQKPVAHAQIQAVNADIEISVPRDSNLNWVANTLRGDAMTNLPIRADLLGTAFRGTVNSPGGPTLTTQTMLGSIRLLGNGLDPRTARSLRSSVVRVRQPKTLFLQPARRVQLPIIEGGFDFKASVSDIEVGEIRGDARVETAAGEIKLGMVLGDCNVTSMGGPLDLGDIMGVLTASTQAGDILVRSMREGGRLSTAGGIIRLLYTGGPTMLQSGGGDIVVRQAAGPINAETHSGDINITADPTQKTQRFEARTGQGNITLNLNPGFGAEIDAMVVTSDANTNAIHSDFTGLQFRKEQLGKKTRIRATGKLNGGGERVELYAEEGDIHIANMTSSPVTVVTPPQR
jgi:DUF4097 and DUF4098 domain-containing protein YvlB